MVKILLEILILNVKIVEGWNYTTYEQFKTFGVLDFYVKINLMVIIDSICIYWNSNIKQHWNQYLRIIIMEFPVPLKLLWWWITLCMVNRTLTPIDIFHLFRKYLVLMTKIRISWKLVKYDCYNFTWSAKNL